MTAGRIDLHDLSYLAGGSSRQIDALAVIRELGLWEALADYTPALAGTVPLGVDTPESDLDVICEARDLAAFTERVVGLYAGERDFGWQRGEHQGAESVAAWFSRDVWSFELFAQPVPVARQYACLHLLVEARLLELGGKPARDAIREMKREDWETEPAFAEYFGIAGDPYEELARLADVSDDELRRAISRAL